MPVTRYGIYLAYPPGIDLRGQGLGRYLAAFLKSAKERKDIGLTVLCPQWMRQSLLDLCETEHVDPRGFEILSPRGTPVLIHVSRLLQSLAAALRPSNIILLAKALWARLRRSEDGLGSSNLTMLLERVVSATGVGGALLLFVLMIPVAFLSFVGAAIASTCVLLFSLISIIRGRLRRSAAFAKAFGLFKTILRGDKNNDFIVHLYQIIENDQARRMITLANKRRDIVAWYAPTAFWEHFNDIQAPKLMCVPDNVLADFPVGFARIGSNRFAETFKTIGRAIARSDHIVTYSDYIKWENVVKYYGKDPAKIHSVYHAPNTLDGFLGAYAKKKGTGDRTADCRVLFKTALAKATNKAYAASITEPDFNYLFFPSQIRPNKNILNLLRAYASLLREGKFAHKLILTGHPLVMPEIAAFVRDHHLDKDVLFLTGLSTEELAACYALADLVVNPSLSEGGCPFMFTEGLSVGTPVVTARLPVTLEVLNDAALQRVMYFDPYDWKDMAARILWGVQNRATLLAVEMPIYQQLLRRTWADVVGDHIDILNAIKKEGNYA